MTRRVSVWDGAREIAERKVLEEESFHADDFSLTLAKEDIRTPTDWCIQVPHHTVVVHLSGELRRMESVFRNGPASDTLPAVGDVWVIPADSHYAALAEGENVRFAEYKVPIDPDLPGDLAARIAHRDPFLHHASAKAAALTSHPGAAARQALMGLMQTLRFHIEDHYVHGSVDARSSNPATERTLSERQKNHLVAYVQREMESPIRVAHLAQAVGLPMPIFLASFKASFGMTPWQYVLRRRLAEARRLLEQGEMNVTAISVATGFSNPSHLATAFARQFGVAPTAYRTRNLLA